MQTNCWEAKKCGRQPGGPRAKELGVCPAATATNLHGKNSGINAGRYCWKISGTLCGGKIQGSFASKVGNCMACDFFKVVKIEEGANFQL